MPRIPRAIVDAMVAHARAELPNEACGMVHARDGVPIEVHRVRNIANKDANGKPIGGSPYRYEMDPLRLMRLEEQRDETGEELVAIYHSHVASQAKPSPTDVRNAFFPQGETWRDPMYPETFYIVISLARTEGDVVIPEEPPVVRAWRVHSAATVDAAIAALEEEPIEVV